MRQEPAIGHSRLLPKSELDWIITAQNFSRRSVSSACPCRAGTAFGHHLDQAFAQIPTRASLQQRHARASPASRTCRHPSLCPDPPRPRLTVPLPTPAGRRHTHRCGR